MMLKAPRCYRRRRRQERRSGRPATAPTRNIFSAAPRARPQPAWGRCRDLATAEPGAPRFSAYPSPAPGPRKFAQSSSPKHPPRPCSAVRPAGGLAPRIDAKSRQCRDDAERHAAFFFADLRKQEGGELRRKTAELRRTGRRQVGRAHAACRPRRQGNGRRSTRDPFGPRSIKSGMHSPGSYPELFGELFGFILQRTIFTRNLKGQYSWVFCLYFHEIGVLSGSIHYI